MPEIRCYMVIDAAAPRLLAQWLALIGAAKDNPMINAIRSKAMARNQPHNHANIDRYSNTMQAVIGDFEIDASDRPELEAVLNTLCVLHNVVVPGVLNRFRAIIEIEIRGAAVELGFVALAPLLTVAIIGFGDRLQAIGEAQTYIQNNAVNWESAI